MIRSRDRGFACTSEAEGVFLVGYYTDDLEVGHRGSGSIDEGLKVGAIARDEDSGFGGRGARKRFRHFEDLINQRRKECSESYKSL